MKLFIYVLFLSIWANECLNISVSNGSSTKGNKSQLAMEKLDDFRKQLHEVITGIMMISFFITCFCLIHYNCMIEPLKEQNVKKEDTEAKSSCPSILPLSESKTKDLNLHSPEKQALLPSIDNLSKPSISEKSATPSHAEKLIKQSSSKNSPTSPELTELRRSSYQKKARRTHLKGSHKLAHSRKRAKRVSSPNPRKPVRIHLQASLQYLGKPTKSPYTEKQILPPKPKKLAMPPEKCVLKIPGSVGKADKVSKPLAGKTSQYFKERSLVCKTSEALANNISEETKENDGYFHVSSEMMSFGKLGHQEDSQDHAYIVNVSGNDMIHDRDDDSDREISIICNITSNDIILNDIYN